LGRHPLHSRPALNGPRRASGRGCGGQSACLAHRRTVSSMYARLQSGEAAKRSERSRSGVSAVASQRRRIGAEPNGSDQPQPRQQRQRQQCKRFALLRGSNPDPNAGNNDAKTPRTAECQIRLGHAAPFVQRPRQPTRRQWSKTQQTNAAQLANMTMSMTCPLRRHRCWRCQVKSRMGSSCEECSPKDSD
jgi:hypothetical protein